jgi:signal peptidase I
MARERSTAREYLEALLIAAVFLGFTNTFVVKTFYIPSSSMESTLLVGDHLFVNRFVFGPAPTGPERALLPLRPVRRGDIVIFRSVENPTVDMVKRCVALPGDTVAMRDKLLFINGQRVADELYAVRRDPRLFPDRPGVSDQGRRRDNFGPLEVPPGHYFCMGDNRDFSWDSRFWGPLPAQMIKGRPVFIYWSYGGETSDGSWHGWGPRLRQLLGTVVGFFTRTRWERTFQLIR